MQIYIWLFKNNIFPPNMRFFENLELIFCILLMGIFRYLYILVLFIIWFHCSWFDSTVSRTDITSELQAYWTRVSLWVVCQTTWSPFCELLGYMRTWFVWAKSASFPCCPLVIYLALTHLIGPVWIADRRPRSYLRFERMITDV